MEARMLASLAVFVGLLLVAFSAHAQSYTCPETPTWAAVPCSMHRAIMPGDAAPHHLTHLYEKDKGRRTYAVVAGSGTARLDIYGHFDNNAWVARRVARAWAGQPSALRRSAMPLVVGVDYAGPVYWDYTQEPQQAHFIEFPASYVHEDANTLDWAFEELLTHEMCHVIDKKGGRFSDMQDWRDAVAADCDESGATTYVSDYAATSNVEDFAESCTAYILVGVGGRLTAVHRERVANQMASRVAYFDRLFSRWDDLIAFP